VREQRTIHQKTSNSCAMIITTVRTTYTLKHGQIERPHSTFYITFVL